MRILYEVFALRHGNTNYLVHMPRTEIFHSAHIIKFFLYTKRGGQDSLVYPKTYYSTLRLRSDGNRLNENLIIKLHNLWIEINIRSQRRKELKKVPV